MTIVVVLLGVMAGLAWFLPDDRKREPSEHAQEASAEQTPNV